MTLFFLVARAFLSVAESQGLRRLLKNDNLYFRSFLVAKIARKSMLTAQHMARLGCLCTLQVMDTSFTEARGLGTGQGPWPCKSHLKFKHFLNKHKLR